MSQKGTQPAPLFNDTKDYTKVNDLASMIVDNMPLEGTWFYVNSGMTSNIIFPDFNINEDQAEKLGASSTSTGVSGEDDVYVDSLSAIPNELKQYLTGGEKNDSSVKILDLAGSDYDGADVYNYSIDLPIGNFASFTAGSGDNQATRFFSVANSVTKSLRVQPGDLITEFIDSNYRNNPVVIKALSGLAATDEGSKELPTLLDSLRANGKGITVTPGATSSYGGPNNGLQNRGDVVEASYTVKVDIPVVLDKNGDPAQLYYNNPTRPAGFPNGSYSFKTDDGLDQKIGYKQSYDLADYYVAYNKGSNPSLVYTAISYSPNGKEEAAYNNLTANPIVERAKVDNSSDGGSTPSAIGVQPGLRDLLLRAYGDIAYQLSAKELEEIEDAQDNLIKDLTDLANKIKASYLSNPVFKDDPLFASESGGDAQFQYRTVASTLYQMATIIYYNYNQLVNPDTYTYKQIERNYDNALKAGDANDVLDMHQKGIGQLFAQLSSAQLDWQGTIYSNFGTITPDNDLKIPPNTLPWDAEFYQEYKQIRLKGNYDTFFNKTDVAAYFQSSLQGAIRYLIDLNTLNKGNKYTHNTPDQFVYLVGDTDVPYGPAVNTFPRPASPEKNSVSIQIRTKTDEETSSSSTSTTSVSYSAELSASNWWYSASASTQGNYQESDSMSKATQKTSSQDISLSYDNMGQQPISLGSSWFKPEILREAWRKKTTRNNPNWEGGFGFYSPDDQMKYITADLYYVSNYAFGDQTLSIELASTSDTQESTEHFDSYSQTTSVAASVGWGPFKASTESSVSTSNENRSSAFSAQSTAQGMQINAQPLKAYQSDEIIEANGQPKMLVAVEVTQIGGANLSPQNSETESSSRFSLRGAKSSASLRSMRSLKEGDSEDEKYGTREGEFTIASPDDYDADGGNKYSLGGGDDHHFGGQSHDVVNGGRGHDILVGWFGNDKLRGGKGSDTLYGGAGKNVLHGGEGEDYFVIERHNTNKGTRHKILDASTDDTLVFSGYHPQDIKVRGNGRLVAYGRVIATLKGAEEELMNLLVSEAIFN